ncbi:MAG: hypothetical protein IPO27_03110 [Bacteroidetes bacterium]|nr:hypothetical protein [Bacteroidota bacterium]
MMTGYYEQYRIILLYKSNATCNTNLGAIQRKGDCENRIKELKDDFALKVLMSFLHSSSIAYGKFSLQYHQLVQTG